MKLADRSPGLLLVLAAVAVYSTVLIEIGMWMVASTAAVVMTLMLAAGVAVATCRWLMSVLSDEDSAV